MRSAGAVFPSPTFRTQLFSDALHTQGRVIELDSKRITLGMAMVLLRSTRHRQVEAHLFWVAAALVVMGVIDGMQGVKRYGVV